jgi:hypothetical protein
MRAAYVLLSGRTCLERVNKSLEIDKLPAVRLDITMFDRATPLAARSS